MPSGTRGGHRLIRVCLPAGLLLTLISSTAAEAPRAVPAEPAAPVLEVEVADGLLTLHADGAPLAEVLRAIGVASGFEVVLRGTFAAPVRESFADRPLEDAIRRLAEGHSVVILYNQEGPSSGDPTLAEVRVIENPARAAVAAARSAEPGRDDGEVAQDDAADHPPMDRETFRVANLGVPPPTREEIVLDLADPDQHARVAAVPKVGSLAPRAAIEIISHVFANENDATVRSRAVAALTRLDGSGVRGLLRERALDDDDSGLRMQALNALASSQGDRSVNILGRALRQDSEAQVRRAAIRALQRVGGSWARRYVEQAARDPDPELGLAAEQALAIWPQTADIRRRERPSTTPRRTPSSP